MAQVITLHKTASASFLATVAQITKVEQDASPDKRKVFLADGTSVLVTESLADIEAAANA